MKLTPQERDRLLIATAAMVARGRSERGLRLNAPETIALVAWTVIEAARSPRAKNGADTGAGWPSMTHGGGTGTIAIRALPQSSLCFCWLCSSAPGRIRTGADGSGGRCCAPIWPGLMR